MRPNGIGETLVDSKTHEGDRWCRDRMKTIRVMSIVVSNIIS